MVNEPTQGKGKDRSSWGREYYQGRSIARHVCLFINSADTLLRAQGRTKGWTILQTLSVNMWRERKTLLV